MIPLYSLIYFCSDFQDNKNKNGGRLQTIANFFQKIASNHRGSQQQNGVLNESPLSSEQSSNSSHSEFLPPITINRSSPLTAQRGNTPSYASHEYPAVFISGDKSQHNLNLFITPLPVKLKTVEQFQ